MVAEGSRLGRLDPGLPSRTDDAVTHFDRDDGPRRLRHRRVTYIVGFVLMALIVILGGVSDRQGWTSAFGVSTGTASSRAGGYELRVHYPTVTRPALASPFDVRVQRDGGFDRPVHIAVTWSWLEMWDENAWTPTPSGAWADDDHLVMAFDPPPGEVLRVVYDARIQPAQQAGRTATVAVLEEGDEVVHVRFRTRVLP